MISETEEEYRTAVFSKCATQWRTRKVRKVLEAKEKAVEELEKSVKLLKDKNKAAFNKLKNPNDSSRAGNKSETKSKTKEVAIGDLRKELMEREKALNRLYRFL
eukprot:TRINITY_DN4112_c0_g3_i1.p2 TRINITY_DN4112_c0_g3~~TRINITY_DN4112_c0_g3_i1.p2  ORF type:complete len:104 (-),score=31.92 TRINITY_DN4112_c0_g3_i1:1321-1632(-)